MTNNVVLQVQPGKINLSPIGFHQNAIYFYQCNRDYIVPSGFSPVRLHLLALSIELELKSRHLHTEDLKAMRKDYGHDLVKSYNTLPENLQGLSMAEYDLLKVVNGLYVPRKGTTRSKQLEYYHPHHSISGYAGFPDPNAIDPIAKKLIGDIPEETFLRQLFRRLGQRIFGNRNQVRITRPPLTSLGHFKTGGKQ